MDSTQPAMNSIVHNTGSQTAIATITLERHYTVSELSQLWLFSENTIRRLFDKEPGVIKICRPQSKKKRSYTSLRIPERIAIRVYRRMQGIS
jgi:hypothetical protein